VEGLGPGSGWGGGVGAVGGGGGGGLARRYRGAEPKWRALYHGPPHAYSPVLNGESGRQDT